VAFDQKLTKQPADALRPVNPDNARGLCITAAAGTELATSYSYGTVICSSHKKAVYTPEGFFLHAASLHQPFGHCGIFSTAASRRSQDSVSVPMRRATLSRPLPVIALVSHYLANKLIGHRPLPYRRSFTYLAFARQDHRALAPLSQCYSRVWGRLPMCYSPVCRSQHHF
jgi:hypothetical protein